MTKYVYNFGGGKAEGATKMKNLLGGKGANLAEMNLIGVPVPAGFTITTEVCTKWYDDGVDATIAAIKPQVEDGVAQIAQQAGANVIPIQVKANRFWQLGSWDGFLIPKPFARVTVTIGPPLVPPPKPVTSTWLSACL